MTKTKKILLAVVPVLAVLTIEAGIALQRNLSANIFPRESGSNLSVHSKLGTGKIVKEIGGLQRRLPCPASISLEIRKNPNRKELQPKAVAGRRSALVTLLRRHLSLTRSILIMKMVRICLFEAIP
ncbi:hypothetical protein [Ruthenibacterium lactatiformans]|uniref:hypothetical protein n=1 Tax=Ruthenibacterium lactatiformans TaxID=1550024 RepID=UPI003D767425